MLGQQRKREHSPAFDLCAERAPVCMEVRASASLCFPWLSRGPAGTESGAGRPAEGRGGWWGWGCAVRQEDRLLEGDDHTAGAIITPDGGCRRKLVQCRLAVRDSIHTASD